MACGDSQVHEEVWDVKEAWDNSEPSSSTSTMEQAGPD